jgi:hypothetical protein
MACPNKALGVGISSIQTNPRVGPYSHNVLYAGPYLLCKAHHLIIVDMIIELPSIFLIIASRKVNKLRTSSSILFEHLSNWYPLLDPRLTIHHSNMGFCLRQGAKLVTSTLKVRGCQLVCFSMFSNFYRSYILHKNYVTLATTGLKIGLPLI